MFAVPAAETDDPKVALALADLAYEYGDYPKVIKLLTPFIEPEIRFPDPENVAHVYEVLGLSSAFLEQEKPARMWFERLIRHRPDWKLNPALVPPATIQLFEEVRDSLREELDRERQLFLERQKEEEERRRLANSTQVIFEKRRNSRVVALVPFGAGQFQNDQPVLGALFLGSELLAVSLSIGFYAGVEDLRQPDGRFAREDVSRAESLQTAQLVSGGAALALMVAGITHALLTFKEDVDVQRTTIKPTANGFLWRF